MKDIDTNAQDGHRCPDSKENRRVVTSTFSLYVPASDMAITASIEYISASANRFNRTAAASSASLVAFGSGKFVALWDTQVSFPLVGVVI
jgi:hypothetical protein